MPKHKSTLAIGGTAYGHFLDLMTEMEETISRGRVLWTEETADAARCRLENMAVQLAAIESRVRNSR